MDLPVDIFQVTEGICHPNTTVQNALDTPSPLLSPFLTSDSSIGLSKQLSPDSDIKPKTLFVNPEVIPTNILGDSGELDELQIPGILPQDNPFTALMLALSGVEYPTLPPCEQHHTSPVVSHPSWEPILDPPLLEIFLRPDPPCP